MNTSKLIKSIVISLKKLDEQKQFKIADKIFNNIRTAQEVNPKSYADLMEEMREYAVSPEALKAGYKSLALKYHPDQNNNNPIATENFKLLQQVYGRLRAEVNHSKDSNNFFTSDPITNLRATVDIEYYDAGYEEDQRFIFNEDQIIATYADYLKWSKHYRTTKKSGDQPPIKVSFTENDIDDIISALTQFGVEQAEKVRNVEVQFDYNDKNGKPNGWNSSTPFYAAFLEDDDEMDSLE